MRYIMGVFLILLISCSKSSDPAPAASTTPTITPKDFVGIWLGSADSVTGCTNGVNNSVEQGCTICHSYTFTETTASFNIPGTPSGTYTIKGDSILMPFLVNFNLHKRVFKLDGKKLTLSSGVGGGCLNNNIYLKN